MVRGMMSVAALALALSMAGPALAKPAAKAVKAPTCAACKMTLSTKKTGMYTRPVKIGGRTYYCCSGCNMKMAAKPAGKSKKAK